jgi:hypothetical protein
MAIYQCTVEQEGRCLLCGETSADLVFAKCFDDATYYALAGEKGSDAMFGLRCRGHYPEWVDGDRRPFDPRDEDPDPGWRQVACGVPRGE